jgi:ABC-type multidrug transport system fused ATPase/permease subunit
MLLLLAVCVALLLLVVGLSPDANTPSVVVLAVAVVRMSLPIFRWREALEKVRRGDASAAEIFAYLDQTPPVGQMAGAATLEPVSRSVQWEKIRISEDKEGPAASVLSLVVPAGSLAVFLSSECRTPQTLLGLCLRYRDPAAGRILLDDRDIRTATLRSLRQQITLAPADGMLFTATIAENIRGGRAEYSQDQLEQAAQLCGVLDAVQNLPHGFQTTVGPRGRSLSTLVAFRIGLARALLGSPSVVIVEEPRGSWDEATAAALDRTFQQIRTGRTLIVLPARLATLRAADRVHLFHQGSLRTSGTHAELLQQDALYRHLNYVLFNPFRDVKPCEPSAPSE